MYGRAMWEATTKNTVMHRIDSRTKLVLLAFLSAGAILIDSTITLYLLFVATLLGHLLAVHEINRWRLLILLIIFNIWGTMLSQSIFYNAVPKTPLFTIMPPDFPLLGRITGGIYIYLEGLAYGARQALRSSMMLSVGLLVCWTTNTRDILRSFLYWKMPYELAFINVTSLRFLPDIFYEADAVMTAQRLRGYDPLKSISILRVIEVGRQTLLPVLARSIRRAITLALSVESRGFGRKQSSIYMEEWPLREKIFVACSLTVLLAVVAVKIIDWLSFNGLVYFTWFRGGYDMIRVWL